MIIRILTSIQLLCLNLVFAKDVDLSNSVTKDTSGCEASSPSLINSQPSIKSIEADLEQVVRNLKKSECVIVKNHGLSNLVNGKLSAFWGYDFIGVDLAHEVLGPMAEQMVSVKTATSEVINLKEVPSERLSLSLRESAKTQESQDHYGHGTSVANIIYGNSILGISTKSELTLTNLFSKNNDDKKFALNDLIANKVKVFQSSEAVRYPDDLAKMRELGIISFRSAGNGYPSNEISQEAPETSVIVGQLSPLGGMSSDSSSFKDVKIAAPGRVYSFQNGETGLFGGTSGAQPVTTGCFLNVVSLLPDITPSEAEIMIEKSAIPTLNSRDKTGSNGKGTVNCLKLAKVAMRLKKNWPQDRAKIADASSYDFQDDSKNLVELADKLKESKKTCDIAERLKLLRQAFLLNPNNKETIAKLAQLYRGLGLTGNANLYQSMLGFSPEQFKGLYNEYKGSEFEADVIRLISDFYPEQKGIFFDGINSLDEETVMLTAHLGKNIIPEKKVQTNLLRIFKDDKVDAMLAPNFLEEYFKNYKFPASDLLKVCENKMPKWEKGQLDNVITCLLVLSYDQKAASQFVLKQLRRNSETFKENFLNNAAVTIKTDKNIPNILSAVVNSPEWTKAEKEKINELLKQTPE